MASGYGGGGLGDFLGVARVVSGRFEDTNEELLHSHFPSLFIILFVG